MWCNRVSVVSVNMVVSIKCHGITGVFSILWYSSLWHNRGACLASNLLFVQLTFRPTFEETCFCPSSNLLIVQVAHRPIDVPSKVLPLLLYLRLLSVQFAHRPIDVSSKVLPLLLYRRLFSVQLTFRPTLHKNMYGASEVTLSWLYFLYFLGMYDGWTL